MHITYFLVSCAAYSVYLPPMGRRRSVKKYCGPDQCNVIE